MSDSFRKVQPGERLRIPADAYNAFIDAAIANREGNSGAVPASLGERVVRIQNNSGTDRDRFDVLGIDSSVPITPSDNLDAFKQHFILGGATPTSNHAGKFVILLEPIANGKVGAALAIGVGVCQVLVTSGSAKYADVDPADSTRLKEASSGAQILWIESGSSGEKWAIIRLGGGGGGDGGVRCFAQLKTAVDGTTIGPVFVDHVASIIGTNPTASSTESVSAYNLMHRKGSASATCIIVKIKEAFGGAAAGAFVIEDIDCST